MIIHIPLPAALKNLLVLGEKPTSAVPVRRDPAEDHESVRLITDGFRLSQVDRLSILGSLGDDDGIGQDLRARQVREVLKQLCPGVRFMKTVN